MSAGLAGGGREWEWAVAGERLSGVGGILQGLIERKRTNGGWREWAGMAGMGGGDGVQAAEQECGGYADMPATSTVPYAGNVL